MLFVIVVLVAVVVDGSKTIKYYKRLFFLQLLRLNLSKVTYNKWIRWLGDMWLWQG